MPLFDYQALTPAGKKTSGIVEAENAKAARQKLKKQGVMVTSIFEKTVQRQAATGGGLPFMGGRVSSAEVSMMTRQLASLIKANIPLVESLNAIVEQAENPTLKVAMSTVRQDVNEGLSLAKAMIKHPQIFDHIYINMIEAGESSGTLGLVMLRLADLKEAQLRLVSKIKSAMTYPALMMSVAAVLMTAIFTFVIPKMATLFESMNKPMPPLTVFLIQFSGFVTDYWWAILAVIIFSVSSFLKWKKTAAGKARWDRFILRIPVVGILIRMIAITRFATTMGTLLNSGVPILSAMTISKNLVGNIPIANAIEVARENITEGQSIAEPLRRSGEFPPVVIHMISIGEKTGELPNMLLNVAANYEEQVNTRIEGLTSLLEPAMIVGMGLTVAFIVVAIFVPLLDMSNIS